MAVLNYESPRTLEAAVAILGASKGKAKILAGGTDLIVQMRSDNMVPETIVDIKRIPEITKIVNKGGEFFIGAGVTGAVFSENLEVGKIWPGVVEALELIGSTQIQGRATIGGNLCNGSPAADSVPALMAANGVAVISGSNGKREVQVEDFLTGPGKSVLRSEEVLVAIKLPHRLPRSADAYLRFIPRTEMDIAVVGAGVDLSLDEAGYCIAARVALGAVADKPLLVSEATDVLVGTKLDEEAMERLAEVARAACDPINDKRGTKEFRVEVSGTLACRAAKIAYERARSK